MAWELRSFFSLGRHDIHTTSSIEDTVGRHILALAFHREKLHCLYETWVMWVLNVRDYRPGKLV